MAATDPRLRFRGRRVIQDAAVRFDWPCALEMGAGGAVGGGVVGGMVGGGVEFGVGSKCS